jgi:hypothetical protein
MTKRPSLASNMKALAEPTAPDPVALVAKAREEREASPTPAQVAAPKAFHAATREGMKRLLTPIEPALHKRLKLLAVQQETTLEAITRAALAEYVAKHD